MTVTSYPNMVLERAAKSLTERERSHGDTEKLMDRTAALQLAYLRSVGIDRGERGFRPHDTIVLNILAEVAKLEGTDSNFTDVWTAIAMSAAMGANVTVAKIAIPVFSAPKREQAPLADALKAAEATK